MSKFDELYDRKIDEIGPGDMSTGGRNVVVAFDDTHQELVEGGVSADDIRRALFSLAKLKDAAAAVESHWGQPFFYDEADNYINFDELTDYWKDYLENEKTNADNH